jgi:hypothetical protein
VQPGTYQICVQMAKTVYLNPCQWDNTPRLIEVATRANNRTVNEDIRMSVGTFVSLYLDDPGGHIDRNLNKTARGVLLVEARGRQGASVAADLQYVSKTESAYSVAVPKNVANRLEVRSGLFQFEDPADARRPLTGRPGVDFTPGASEERKVIRLVVKGVTP